MENATPEWFRMLCYEKYSHDRYAAALWSALDSEKLYAMGGYLEAADLPCAAWCMLSCDLPEALLLHMQKSDIK